MPGNIIVTLASLFKLVYLHPVGVHPWVISSSSTRLARG